MLQKNFQNDKTGIFGELGLEQTGQGKKLITNKTDSIFEKGKSFVNKILRAKSRRGKMQLKNLSEENIRQIDGLIREKTEKHVSREIAHLTRREVKDIKIKGRKMVYDKKANFTKEDFKDLKRAIGAIRAGGERAKHATHILHTSGISSDNSRVDSNTGGNFKSSEKEQNKNDFQFGYQFGNNNNKDKKEKKAIQPGYFFKKDKEEEKPANNTKDTKSYQPPREDEEIKNLRNKANDLPI